MNKMARSVYIHIPFCKLKCKYCSFISFPCINKIETYLNSLLEEIKTNYKGELLRTLYFGGGTPSLLEVKYLKRIINSFNLASNCETTLELNPDDANYEYLEELYKIGINRLSIGAQTFNDDILKLIGRRHSSEQVFNAVNLAQKVGFKNISVDLIYGLPEQNLQILNEDLNKITSLGIQHVSTYGLKIEEESYWGKFPPENYADEDLQADMYLAVNNFLESKGYKRYEISNFALKGFESKHNLNYWDNNEYYGFGVASHGYINGKRYSNICNLEEYIKTPLIPESIHTQTFQEKIEEEIFLGFRKESGISISKIKEKFNIDFNNKYERVIKKYSPKYIEPTTNGYKLTLDGILLSNNILSEFLD